MVMTLLTCGNELVSCGNDFANLWERVVSCGNDFASLWEQLSILW